jgi:hypothetical protein
MLIEGQAAALYERIERIVMEIPGIYECTVEVGGLTAKLAFVNSDAAVPIPPTPRCRVAGPPTREPRAPGVTPGVFFYEGRRDSHTWVNFRPAGASRPFPFACFAGYDSSLARAKP